ncbi:Uncharacterised protein [uncultured Clostridium sp.]|uniref:phBC6A51 family helix-turn-helix protein n=1 Tax=uncultured Clostridium sp. TaxID=59620 RepID=UPI000821DE24|nr:helix-turn-helix domain-containing protein [uncultured Clostridium sp.]SCI99707.1 Uncharacterised protein [uncultured Clostridium sp.]
MVLNKKHYEAIELLVKGENITNVAKIVGCDRTSIYNWFKDSEFKATLNEYQQSIKTEGENILKSKLTTYIQELEKIALTGKSEKNKLDALEYLVNRVMGTPTNKQEITTEENTNKANDNIDLDSLLNEYNQEDNIIELDKIAK